jgi:hypothetical protein
MINSINVVTVWIENKSVDHFTVAGLKCEMVPSHHFTDSAWLHVGTDVILRNEQPILALEYRDFSK